MNLRWQKNGAQLPFSYIFTLRSPFLLLWKPTGNTTFIEKTCHKGQMWNSRFLYYILSKGPGFLATASLACLPRWKGGELWSKEHQTGQEPLSGDGRFPFLNRPRPCHLIWRRLSPPCPWAAAGGASSPPEAPGARSRRWRRCCAAWPSAGDRTAG